MARPQFFPIFQLAHILRGISQDPEGKSRMQHNPTYVDGERREMLRTMLLQLREHTCQRIKDFRREQRQESESGPGDYVDMARWSADVETHAGLIARAEEKLKYLDEAISQLEAGTYGSCVGCHQPIPIERLIAVPFALYCLYCQRRRKPSQDTWSRGGTIAPTIGSGRRPTK